MSVQPSSYVVLVMRCPLSGGPSNVHWLAQAAPRVPEAHQFVSAQSAAHHFTSYKDAAQAAGVVYGYVVALSRGATEQHASMNRDYERAQVVASATKPQSKRRQQP